MNENLIEGVKAAGHSDHVEYHSAVRSRDRRDRAGGRMAWLQRIRIRRASSSKSPRRSFTASNVSATVYTCNKDICSHFIGNHKHSNFYDRVQNSPFQTPKRPPQMPIGAQSCSPVCKALIVAKVA